MSDKLPRTPLDQACSVSNEELCAGALAHYEKLATLAHEWNNQIPQAIKAWYAAKAPRSETAAKNRLTYVIEKGSPAQYFSGFDYGQGKWTAEYAKALHFGTREEAQRLWDTDVPIFTIYNDGCRIEEHMECGGPEALPSATPRKALVEKVAKFADLPEGWNSYGAKAFSERTVLLAMEIAELLDDEWGTVPVADGSIWFTRNNEDDIIEVRSNDE